MTKMVHRAAFSPWRSTVRPKSAILPIVAVIASLLAPAPASATGSMPEVVAGSPAARLEPAADTSVVESSIGVPWRTGHSIDLRVARAAPNPYLDRRSLALAPTSSVPPTVARSERVVVTWSEPLTATQSRAPARLQNLSAQVGRMVRFVRTLGPGRAVYAVDRRGAATTGDIRTSLSDIEGVVRVELDLWATVDAVPTDPLAADLWGLLGPADGSPYGINAPGAWARGTGSGQVVAVIDTGIVAHPDLAGQIVPGWDMVSSTGFSNDGDGRDDDGSDPGDWGCGRNSSWHGTHVAGTIAALADNGIGVFGGARGAKVQSVRALGSCGGYASDIADAIRWAAGLSVPGASENPTPARILNLSLGGDGACPSYVEAAIADARAVGAVVVIAAGNANADAASFFPANCPGAFTVAAIAEDGLRASFSNHGRVVDIAGPGVGVWSSIDTGATTPTGPGYAPYSGTSMAAPHVAAAAALVASAYPDVDRDGIEGVLRVSAGPLAEDAGIDGCPALGCGSGHADAAAAVTTLGLSVPVVGALSVSPNQIGTGQVDVTATAVDRDGIVSATVTIDGGAPLAMAAEDGSFGGDAEGLLRRLTAPSAQGTHTICVLARDPGAMTSAPACTTLTVDTTAPALSGVAASPATVASGTPSRVSATATDVNGIAATEVRVDEGAWVPVARTPEGPSPAWLATRVDDPAQEISAGLYHVCALATGGTVQCWGYNGLGALGDGTTAERLVPSTIAGLTGVTEIAAGGYHTCALLPNTTVRCWGSNVDGQLGDGTTIDRLSPVTVTGLSGVEALAAGAFHTCALLTSGAVRCWGSNDHGSIGDGTTAGSSVPVPVTGLSDATAIASGGLHTCVLRGSSTPRCWGYNAYGQLGNGSTTDATEPVDVSGLTGVSQLSGGLLHTCARVSGGAVRCWGFNGAGGLGAVSGDVCSGFACALTPVTVAGLSGASDVRAGGYFTCAGLPDGSMRCWGDNIVGSLGDGTTGDRLTPVEVFGLTGVVQATAGRYHACAVRTDGSVRCWGLGLNGQLGVGETGIWTTATGVIGQDGPLEAGARSVCFRATDPAGNRSGGSCATVTVLDPTAPVARILAAQVGDPSGATSIDYYIGFDGAVTGLVASDLTLSGTSSGWSISSILSNGASQTVRVTGTGTPSGSLGLTLKAGSVVDGGGNTGPASAVAAAVRTIDHTAPSVSMPTLDPSTTGLDPVLVTTTATDAGGVGGSEVRIGLGPWTPMAPTDGSVGGTTDEFRVLLNDPVLTIDAGREHSCAVLRSGTIRCWGFNGFGQLGDGTTTDRTAPVQVSGISDAVAVATGNVHTCALLGDGTVWCWGAAIFEGSAIGPASLQSLTPQLVPGIGSAVALDTGFAHTCAVLADGTVRCWGWNAYGQLGDDSTTDSSTPVVVQGLTGVAAITTGGFHTCVLRTNRTLRCWGMNVQGSLGDGTTVGRKTPVTVIRSAGSTAALADATSVSAGIHHTCASLADGTARCWGFQNSGQIGNGDQETNEVPRTVIGVTDAVAVTAGGTGLGGYAHSCAVLASGGMKCWGFNADGQVGDGTFDWRWDGAVPVTGATGVKIASAGWNHTCTVTYGGAAQCWGSDLDGRVGDGVATLRAIPTRVSGLTTAQELEIGGWRIGVDSPGPVHACARLAGGTVRCWGSNATGQLGDGTTTDRVSPVAVTGLSNVTDLAVGITHSCAVRTDGTVRCWGDNSSGQLGDGTSIERHAPATVVGITSAIKVVTGLRYAGSGPRQQSSSCALTAEGAIWCWGINQGPIAGNGSTQPTAVPVSVTGISTAIDVSMSNDHACAVLADTTVRCWGFNGSGQLGDGTFATRTTPVAVRAGVGTSAPLRGAVAISVGGEHSCAVLADRSVRCWGDDISGQLGDARFVDRPYPVRPMALAGVTEVAAGHRHTCAGLADGSARCWGEPDFGKLGSPPSIFTTGIPQAVYELFGAADLGSGAVNTCATIVDGTARCWGDNRSGQIGDGSTAARTTPRQVVGLTGSLAAGSQQVCVRARDLYGNLSSGTTCRAMTIVDEAPPEVVGFQSTVSSPTGVLTIGYTLTFSEPVTGLAASDFVVGGASAPWIAAVLGSGSTRTITLSATDPTDGALTLTLNARSVQDGSSNVGPSEAHTAPTIRILPFSDIATSTFLEDIVWLSQEGITSGCGVRRYCPAGTVTRAQMASFIARALDLPPTAIDYFDDDDGTTHEADINRLAAAKVTSGCGVRSYCPAAEVTRGQMASFLARAYALPTSATDHFVDDDGTTHEQDIDRLAASGITSGCGPSTYCPTAVVTRGQMAAFLHRAETWASLPTD